MARVSRGVTAHARHKKILKLAKGYRGRSNSSFRVAIERVEKALQYAYRDRRTRKREFRKLWITRLSAACRQRGMHYSTFIHALSQSDILLNRKTLSELAISDPLIFDEIFAAVSQNAA